MKVGPRIEAVLMPSGPRYIAVTQQRTAASRAQCAATHVPRFDVPRWRLRNDGRLLAHCKEMRWQGPATGNTVLLDPPWCSILGTKPLRITTHTLHDRILARAPRMQVSKKKAQATRRFRPEQCMYVCMYACMHACMHACIPARASLARELLMNTRPTSEAMGQKLLADMTVLRKYNTRATR